jgi:hypothetical protein
VRSFKVERNRNHNTHIHMKIMKLNSKRVKKAPIVVELDDRTEI